MNGRDGGCTFSGIVARDSQVTLGHVGDTRAYHFSGCALKQISKDHSLVAALVASGMMTPEEAENSPDRNKVLRSLGSLKQHQPDYVMQLQFTVAVGDRILLLSDGVWGEVPFDDLQGFMEPELGCPGQRHGFDCRTRPVDQVCGFRAFDRRIKGCCSGKGFLKWKDSNESFHFTDKRCKTQKPGTSTGLFLVWQNQQTLVFSKGHPQNLLEVFEARMLPEVGFLLVDLQKATLKVLQVCKLQAGVRFVLQVQVGPGDGFPERRQVMVLPTGHEPHKPQGAQVLWRGLLVVNGVEMQHIA
jgi:hypothetical protein